MLKYRFIKNSSKVILISTALLFISNLILLLSLVFSGFESKIGFLSKLPDVSVYIFTFLVFLALNDEKSAHRKTKDIKSQKSIIVLKGFLIFIFVMYFFKNLIQKAVGGYNNPVINVILNVLFIIASFSFFLLVLSIWYLKRDFKEGKLKYIHLVSIIISAFYAAYKVFFYSSVFNFENALFTNEAQYLFCLLQYIINIVMLFCIKKHYEEKEQKTEQEESEKPKQERPAVVETIEFEKGFGIDFIDDYKNGLKS